MGEKTRRLCTFTINGWCFGVDVCEVQEVHHSQVMTNVPLASDVIRGLMNLRGQVVTVLDLRRRLALDGSSFDRPPMNVVMQIDRELMSFLVEEIGEVIEVADEEIESPPSTIDQRIRMFLSGMVRCNSQLVLILDVKKTMTLSHDVRVQTEVAHV
ncbi:MAG: chemotaxis protein CheW [Nitrospirales bacterium]|nr:MAG: chemotaxis protein CheW [Nitrospirales bacterium]